jgi:hypothetical protein
MSRCGDDIVGPLPRKFHDSIFRLPKLAAIPPLDNNATKLWSLLPGGSYQPSSI